MPREPTRTIWMALALGLRSALEGSYRLVRHPAPAQQRHGK